MLPFLSDETLQAIGLATLIVVPGFLLIKLFRWVVRKMALISLTKSIYHDTVDQHIIEINGLKGQVKQMKQHISDIQVDLKMKHTTTKKK